MCPDGAAIQEISFLTPGRALGQFLPQPAPCLHCRTARRAGRSFCPPRCTLPKKMSRNKRNIRPDKNARTPGPPVRRAREISGLRLSGRPVNERMLRMNGERQRNSRAPLQRRDSNTSSWIPHLTSGRKGSSKIGQEPAQCPPFLIRHRFRMAMRPAAGGFSTFFYVPVPAKKIPPRSGPSCRVCYTDIA